MKIDINKKYTSDGEPVEYLHRVPEGFNTAYPWRGTVGGIERCWTDAGWLLAGEATPSHDLIEVREPREWTLAVKPGTSKAAEIFEDEGPLDLHGWERVRVREIID